MTITVRLSGVTFFVEVVWPLMTSALNKLFCYVLLFGICLLGLGLYVKSTRLWLNLAFTWAKLFSVFNPSGCAICLFLSVNEWWHGALWQHSQQMCLPQHSSVLPTPVTTFPRTNLLNCVITPVTGQDLHSGCSGWRQLAEVKQIILLSKQLSWTNN